VRWTSRSPDLSLSKRLVPGVELVDEDDGGGFLFGEGEAVADQLCAVADEHLDELRAGELEEGSVGLGGAGSGEEGLACAWWAVHESALWCLDANLLEALSLLHGPYDCLHQLLNLLV